VPQYTFCDGICVVKAVSAHPSGPHDTSLDDLPASSSSNTRADVNSVMQKAAQRLSSSSSNQDNPKHKIALEPVSDHESLTVLREPCFFRDFSQPCLKGTFYPISLELLDYETACEREELALTASIIIYNCGIAYSCLAASSTAPRYADKCTSVAYQLIQRAHAGNSGACKSYEHISRRILLDSLALYNLVKMSPRHSSEQNKYYGLREIVEYKMLKMAAIESKLSAQTASAA